ncbi:MAG: hypothetical protein JJE50_03610 [Actinomycetales bacterium]|nr:hypothetical protein [Actinomycetales bacterium]
MGRAPAAVYDGWFGLNSAIKSGMDLRRYELATPACATRLRSSYCALAPDFVEGRPFAHHIGVDRGLYTGQNPASSSALAAASSALAAAIRDAVAGPGER